MPCHPSALRALLAPAHFLNDLDGTHPQPGYSGRARLRDAPVRSRQWMLVRRPDKYLSTSFSLSVGTTLIDTYIQECNTLRQKRRLRTKGRYRKVHIHLYRRSLEHNYLPYRSRSHTYYFVGVGGVWPLSLRSLGLAGRTRGLGECSRQEASLDAYINKRKENI